jgi:hypothetical protein
MNFKCAYDRLPGSYTSKTDASPKSASGKFAEIGTEKRASVDRTDQLSDRRPIGRTIPLTIPRPPSYDETSFWQEFRRTIHARRADRASTYESA